MRTYDIINAGPKNRFLCNGRIVSNSGRLVQPQNFPRPTLKHYAVESGIEALKAGVADVVGFDVMKLTSSALRGCIIPKKGKKLVVADLSNIEGRDQAWLANEQWKLKAFKKYDTFVRDDFGNRIPDGNGDFLREGHDLYAIAYGKMFGVTPQSVMEDQKAGGKQRQVGKTAELACGYGGGVGSFVTFALSFNLDLNFLADSAYDKIDQRILAEAEGMWEWAVKKHRTLDLEKKTFIVMDSFKRQWREAHPNIATLWDLLEQGARLAIANKGEKFKIGKCEFDYTGKWLFLRLPSGRYLCYPQAAVDDKGQLSFMGVNQFTKKWGKIKTYGGRYMKTVLQDRH